VKLDAWGVLAFERIRAAYPDVPWVFVYRDPVEVLVSQLGHRGMHMTPGVLPPELFGLEPAGIWQLPTEEYCARVLGSICRAALAAVGHGDGMLVNHAELSEAGVQRVLSHFRVEVDDAAEVMLATARERNAKNPVLPYVPDADRKQQLATPALRDAVARWVTPHYDKLEQLRRQQLAC
jgi:hypothetical protein